MLPDGTIDWSIPGSNSYVAKAGTESTYFSLGSEWDNLVKKYDLSGPEMFDLFNVPALDDAVAMGKHIKFSHDPTLTDYAGSFLDDEWKYLNSKYEYTTLTKEGDFWVASK